MNNVAAIGQKFVTVRFSDLLLLLQPFYGLLDFVRDYFFRSNGPVLFIFCIQAKRGIAQWPLLNTPPGIRSLLSADLGKRI